MPNPSPTLPSPDQENKLLLGVAGTAGCLLILCILLALVAVGLALFWTATGSLGPSVLLPQPL